MEGRITKAALNGSVWPRTRLNDSMHLVLVMELDLETQLGTKLGRTGLRIMVASNCKLCFDYSMRKYLLVLRLDYTKQFSVCFAGSSNSIVLQKKQNTPPKNQNKNLIEGF